VWLHEVDGPALVLGSTQPAVAAGAAIAVVRRRTGGGAVLLRPGSVVWADVFVPATDRLWQRDVGRAFWWLGQAWVDALTTSGVTDASWHDGSVVRSRWSDAVCFAGLGPGEVTVGGRKVVGISQRRTRDGALFQCAALLAWEPAELVTLLGLGEEATAALADVAAPLSVDGRRLEAEFLIALRER
jgi:lipoate-protein ligase A